MTRSRAAGARRGRAFGGAARISSAAPNSGSGGSTCSQLLLSDSASASASADVVSVSVSVTCTHVTPDSEGEPGVLLLLLPLSSLLLSALSSAAAEDDVASAFAGAVFSSLTDSTTASSVLAFSFSASAAARFSSSSRSFSCENYIFASVMDDAETQTSVDDAPPFPARVPWLHAPS